MNKKKIKKMTASRLKDMTKEECLDFIRYRLSYDGDPRNHMRFEMSGYEIKKGETTKHNLKILNKFAYLGIYDYTEFLTIDFYKGCPAVYFLYWKNSKNYQEIDFSGYGTTQIIYEIFELTIFSGEETRIRRRG